MISCLKIRVSAAPKLTRLHTFTSHHIKMTEIAMYLQSWDMQGHFERRASAELLAVIPSNQLLGRVLFWDTSSCISAQEITGCHRVRKFVSPCTRACNWSHFWARWSPSTTSHCLLTRGACPKWRGSIPCVWLNICDKNFNGIC